MPLTAVKPSQIRKIAANSLVGNATGAEARGTSLSASQVRTLLGLATTSDVTFDIVRATTSVLSPLFNNPNAAATTLGNSTYGVTVPGLVRSTVNGSGGVAVSYAINAGATTGFGAYYDTPAVINAGVAYMWFGAGNVWFNTPYGGYLWLGPDGSGAGLEFAGRTSLYPDAINTLHQRRGTNGQSFFVYNTYASSLTHERGKFAWESNVLKIGTEKGSSGGTARGLALQTDGTDRMTIDSAGAATFTGDISMSKTPAQGYIRAYATDGVKNVAISHNGSNGVFATSSGANTFFSGTGQHYFFDSTGAKYLLFGQSGNAASITSIASAASYLQIITESGQINVASNGVANSTFNVLSGTGGRYTTITHDGTNGILSTSAGNLNLVPTGGTVAVTGGITASGVVSHGAYTVATLPAAGSNAGKMAQVTDSNVAASGNYGATVAAGGANRVKVFSDGTNWVIA